MEARAAERRAGMTLVALPVIAAAEPTTQVEGVVVMPKSVRREVAAESVVAVAKVGGAR